MGGKIDCYVDCVSPYSYFAFLHLQRNRAVLKEYGVEIEFHPVFLGGLHKSVGNQAPIGLPARATQMSYDRDRAKRYFDLPKVNAPDVFPVLTVQAQRAQVYIKENYSREVYESVYKSLWEALWENNQDISKAAIVTQILEKHFSNSQIENILKATQDPTYKQKLNDNTQEAIERGAYGCPWFYVRNAEGKEEPFFGSDRFHHIWDFLGIGWTDITILPPGRDGKAML